MCCVREQATATTLPCDREQLPDRRPPADPVRLAGRQRPVRTAAIRVRTTITGLPITTTAPTVRPILHEEALRAAGQPPEATDR